MAISNGYTTLDELKSWLNISDTSDDTKLEDIITSTSRWIDSYCNRRFWKDTSDAIRTYNATEGNRLYVGDLVSITTLKTDDNRDGTFETTWAASDYQLLPYNPNGADAAQPYEEIVAIGSRAFPLGGGYGYTRQNLVQIVGVFGWDSVPQPVEQACLLQSARIFKRRYSPEGVAGFNDFGVVRVATTDRDVQELLDPYRFVNVH